jgi:Predicted transcriptional regulator
MAKAYQQQDWHKADIKAAVEKKGWNLSALSLASGLPEHSCKNAINGRNIRGEQVIAKLLGVTPEIIWPSRFKQPRKYRRRQASPLPVTGLRQKRKAV